MCTSMLPRRVIVVGGCEMGIVDLEFVGDVGGELSVWVS